MKSLGIDSNNNSLIIPVVDMAHNLLKMKLQKGDTVIDATCGNGHDTYFLCDILGSNGKIYAFDKSSVAISSTKKLLGDEYCKRVVFNNMCHSCMADLISEPVEAIVFNLGYLPGFPDGTATIADTTLLAVKAGIELLRSKGIMIISVYWGHYEGKHEKNTLLEYFSNISSKIGNVMSIGFINKREAPFILVFEKV